MEKLSRFITRLLSISIILMALVVIGLRIGLANIDQFKSDIENWLANDVAPGISFVSIQGSWNQLNPILTLNKASIMLPDRKQTAAIDNMSVEFDIWKSLRIRSPVVREITGTVDRLSLRKDNKQQWWLNEFSLDRISGENSDSDIGQLIAQIPYYLRLQIKQLLVFDQAHGENYEIDDIEIDVQHRDGSYYLQLDANLPGLLGNTLLVKSIISHENSVAYLKSDRLELGRLALLFGINTGGIQHADLSGEIWFNFLNNQTLALNGNIAVDEGLFRHQEGGKLLPFSLRSRVGVYQVDDRWDISNRFESLSIDDLPLKGFATELRVSMDTGRPGLIEGWIEGFELFNLRVLDEGLVPAKIASALNRSELRGQLDDVWFSFDPNDIDSLQLTANATNVSSQPVDGIPGVNHSDGILVFGNRNASLEIDSSQMSLDFADQFRAPLEIGSFNLKANISLREDGLLLSVPEFVAINDDIRAYGRLWMEADKTGKPFLYLRANMEDGHGSSTSKYLPVKLLPQKVVNWLDRGIKTVDISNGNLLFHGRLEHIQSLDRNRSGEMMVDFDVDNTRIIFDSKWAPARDGKGRVLFHNMGVSIDLDNVGFGAIEGASATISIANFKNTIVEAGVISRTHTNTALQTWIGTPVGRKYKAVVNNLRNAEGSVLASIAISIPLKTVDVHPHVNVNLEFDGAAVNAPAWGLEFSQIDGVLRIRDQTITGKGIKALYYKDPVVIDVSSDQQNNRTIIDVGGLIDSPRLLNLLPGYLTQGFAGSSQWGIRVGIANDQSNNDKATVQINAKSELENTEVFFPAPFYKPVNLRQRVTMDISIFGDDSIDFDVGYGPVIKARGQLKRDAEKPYQLSELVLGFSTLLRPISSPGINIYGSIQNFPLDEWIDYYQTKIASDGTDASDALSLVDAVGLDIKTTLFHDRSFTDTVLVMKRAANGFTGTIDSSLMKGTFAIPLQDSPQDPVVVNLEYLKIQATESESESESESTRMMPQDFFNLNLISKVLSYGEFMVTDLELNTRVGGNRLTVDTLSFRHDQVSLASSANWQYLPSLKRHRSSLNLSVSGRELGQTLTALGFGDTMHDGKVKMDGQIRWSGELLHMDWDSLVGDARLQITDGILKNIEPGSGRFVGLLSLNALPRRLALDFKDVLLEGLDFDKISGIYKIEGENLYTYNTKMEGSSAEVKISGKIGLRQRNYDQTMIVVPKIRQTLPVIGGLAAGSTVGWGLILIQNLFKKAIDKSVEIEYKVTGPWGDPQVDLVKKVILKPNRGFKREGNER